MDNILVNQLNEVYTRFCNVFDAKESTMLLDSIAVLSRELAKNYLVNLVDTKNSFLYGDQSLTEQDAEDLASIVATSVSVRLLQQTSGAIKPVENVVAFTKQVAYHAFASEIRVKKPAWRQTEYKLLYLFKQPNSPFGVWDTGHGTPLRDQFSGYIVWRRAKRRLALPHLREMLKNHPFDVLSQTQHGHSDYTSASAWDLLAWIYLALEGPSLFGELISGFLQLRPPQERAYTKREWQRVQDGSSDRADFIPDVTFNPERLLIEQEEAAKQNETHRELLAYLWKCLHAPMMLPHQSAAYLLGLGQRSPGGQGNLRQFAALLHLTVDEIALAMTLPRETVEKIWSHLPLSDKQIGNMYQASPTQIVDYRRAAKKKIALALERKMKEWQPGAKEFA